MAAGNFALALALVLESEGGYVDDPRDPGGATNLGITRATLARWRGRDVSKAEVRDPGAHMRSRQPRWASTSMRSGWLYNDLNRHCPWHE